MRADGKQEVNVVIGDGTAVLRRSGQSQPIIANILGVDRDANGEIERIWLDRVVHRPGESQFIGWNVEGAISSVLTKAGIRR